MAREFRVEKIGDTYVTIPVDHYPGATKTAWGMWGFILAAVGVRRGGLLGTALFAAALLLE